MRKEFERVSPESVGISSGDVMKALDILEGSAVSRPNGIVMARNGKVFAEGWWAPYAAGIPHEIYSMTKTYTVSALGIALQEGKIRSLDDPVLSYLPECRFEGMDPRNEKITIRHLCMMASGKPEIRSLENDWVQHFFRIPITHEPGQWYEYSCEDTHMIMAIVQKAVGRKMDEYLKEKLMEPLGIDTDRIIWAHLDEGSPIGCGGLHVTTEDSLRLGQLYLQKGVWEGRRILPEEFAEEAVQSQILQLSHSDPITEKYAQPGLIPGYGYQIWTDYTGVPGEFCIHGAIGQVCICQPATGLNISYNQTGPGIGSDRRAIAEVFAFLSDTAQKEPLKEEPEMLEKLRRRLKTLSLEKPDTSAKNEYEKQLEGKRFAIADKGLTFRKAGWNHIADSNMILPERGMEWIEFSFPSEKTMQMRFFEDGKEHTITAGTDGASRLNEYAFYKMPEVNMALFDASWPDERTLRICARWLQTSFYIRLDFHFTEEGFTAEICSITGDFDLHPMRNRKVTGTYELRCN